jgi:hypothetical protein
MYLWFCESFKFRKSQKAWVRKSQIRKVPHLKKVRKSNKLLKFTNLRICEFAELICGPPNIGNKWMRSSQWLERLAANAVVATVLGSIPASSDSVESEGRQMEQCWIS